ncbi:MAG: hypothetical protein WCG79_02665 [Verrucomicrobiota bacterium]|jgi:Putative beta-barrel porin 2
MMSWKPILGMVVGSVLAVVANSGAADPLVPTVVPPEMLAPKVAEHGLRLGAFDLHARMSGGMTYDDNITYSSTNRQSDLIGVIAPQISAVMDRRDGDYGTLLSLGYQPTVLLFSDHSNNDTIDQNVKSSFQWSGSKLTLGLSQAFVQTYGGVVEVGDRVRQKIYNTELTSKYALSEKTSIEVNPRLTVTDSDNYVGSRDWGVDTFLNHELGTKLTGSLGTTVGYLDVDDGPGQRYVRMLARLRYAVATKVDLTMSAGSEWRHYNSGVSDDWEPVFGVSGVYRPFDGTTLTLEAHRREEFSILTTGLNYLTTGFTAEIRQRIFEHYFVGVAGGYDNRDYRAAESVVSTSRNDNYGLVRVVAGVQWIERWTVSVFYQYQTNGSNEGIHDFYDNKVGLQSSWGF